MNDNAFPMSPHHAECLRLLNDLHDLLDWADRSGIRVAHDEFDPSYALDFNFWRGELAKVLLIDPTLSRRSA